MALPSMATSKHACSHLCPGKPEAPDKSTQINWLVNFRHHIHAPYRRAVPGTTRDGKHKANLLTTGAPWETRWTEESTPIRAIATFRHYTNPQGGACRKFEIESNQEAEDTATDKEDNQR